MGVLFALTANSYSQTNFKRKAFFEPEYTIGKVIPNYPDTFPSTTVQQGFTINIGSTRLDTSSWAKYYNFPETGIMIHYANFGNNDVFGQQIGINPYISFNVFNQSKGDYKLKFGLGLAYFSTKFDSTTNYTNNMIGSDLNWDFKLFLYRNLIAKEDFNLRIGFGFSHESNGHTRMPNMGINSALFSLSGQFYKKKNNLIETPDRIKGNYHSPKKFFIQVREGYGWQEQSKSEGPQTGRILPVYATSFGGGYIYDQHIKFRAGITYKFYEHYRTHVTENDIDNLSDNPTLAASNLVVYLGNEFLMGHVGMDMELGINVYKPFYNEYHPANKIATVFMRLIATRLGLNLYLFNTHQLPKHNVFLGANINANLGKADFTEFSIGYTYTLNN